VQCLTACGPSIEYVELALDDVGNVLGQQLAERQIRDPRSNSATWSRESGAVLPVDGGLTARLGTPDLA
jgi:hypothetical protein